MSIQPGKELGGGDNRLQPADESVHGWYRFVLSFPPPLVRDLAGKLGVGRGGRILDPFCGTGTTLVECMKIGVDSVGVDGTPMGRFASRVKTDWRPSAAGLIEDAAQVAREARSRIESGEGKALRCLSAETQKTLLKGSLSPLPMHSTLVLLDVLSEREGSVYFDHERLALAKALPCDIGNLKFGPEVGVGTVKDEVDVVEVWHRAVWQIAKDLESVHGLSAGRSEAFLGMRVRCLRSVNRAA